MNNLLELKGQFRSRKNPSKPGTPVLPNGTSISAEFLRKLALELNTIHSTWKNQTYLNKELIAVHQTRVIPKSRRLHVLFSGNGIISDQEIRGARFEKKQIPGIKEPVTCHVFIYYVEKQNMERSIKILRDAAKIIDTYYQGVITYKDTGLQRTHDGEVINPKPYPISAQKVISKSSFFGLIAECLFIDHFDLPQTDISTSESKIIRIYQTDGAISTILGRYGIHISLENIIDETTARLSAKELENLVQNAPYLIAMAVEDMNEIDEIDTMDQLPEHPTIPDPSNEPIIGVIDKPFDTHSYFSKWVEYHDMIDPNIKKSAEDFQHGTRVSSLIVDGPRANPQLDDGCGYFRVRHFGIAVGSRFSLLDVLRKIRKIVEDNQDIRVWNLSLGAQFEIDENSISPIAAELDYLQEKYNIVFIVAGTNKPDGIPEAQKYRIGSPADSINSIVVNSVNIYNQPASYTRTGPVLSFYNKPDISCFGGDGFSEHEKMVVYDPMTKMGSYVCGTSFAAPWIARKMAYLIQVVGLTRETAKALLIDSACGWAGACDDMTGYGIVPIRIEDVLNAKDDEIRFIINGVSSTYETYNFNIPVPVADDRFPYYARATLVYYPSCCADQGVDYTKTELDIHFGRIDDHQQIKDIRRNTQSDEGMQVIYEMDARRHFRKWDNVKLIADNFSSGRDIPRKKYENSVWGLKIIRKERSSLVDPKPIRFGVVVTLKEMFGVNRREEFIRACSLRNWIVNEIDVNTRVSIYQKAEENIHLD